MTSINTNSHSNVGLGNAFQQGVTDLNKSAQSIVNFAQDAVLTGTLETASERAGRSVTESRSVADTLINSKQQLHLFDASARVVDVADKALGALIDIQT